MKYSIIATLVPVFTIMSSILTASALTFNYINVPNTEMREKPDHESEVVSETYYSEQVEIIKTEGDWVQIQTNVDKYNGWVKKSTICERSTNYPIEGQSIVVKVRVPAAHLYNQQDTIYGPIMKLPFESHLEVIDNSDPRWLQVKLIDNKTAYVQRGDVEFNSKTLNLDEACELSKEFMRLPYTWGGRCSFGYDCSGFIQMLLRQMKIFIPRDSKDQFKWEGYKDIDLKDIKRGDIIYFGLDETKIRHVGLYLGNDEFIHSTVAQNKPNIHISNLSESEWNGSGRFKFVAAKRLKQIIN